MGVGGMGGNLLPTDKNRKGTNLLKCPTSKRWGGGGVWGGGEDRCPIDITDLQLTKQNIQVPPRDEQNWRHDKNELRSHSHDQGDSNWDFYGRRQMDQANVKWWCYIYHTIKRKGKRKKIQFSTLMQTKIFGSNTLTIFQIPIYFRGDSSHFSFAWPCKLISKA